MLEALLCFHVKQTNNNAVQTSNIVLANCFFSGPQGPDEGQDDRVKVRVSRVKAGDRKWVDESVRDKETKELEKSVQKELEKAGLGSGGQ